jgi:hypothetical protein
MWGLALLSCPRCRAGRPLEEEEFMPKISRAAGASNTGGVQPGAVVKVKQVLTDKQAAELRDHIEKHGAGGDLPFGATVEDAAAVEPASVPAAAADHAEEGGERSSAGSSSSASSEKPLLSSRKSGRGSRKPARTTGSPSSETRTGTSTAPSTATGGPSTSDTSGLDGG